VGRIGKRGELTSAEGLVKHGQFPHEDAIRPAVIDNMMDGSQEYVFLINGIFSSILLVFKKLLLYNN
jgi:hypothetical protein